MTTLLRSVVTLLAMGIGVAIAGAATAHAAPECTKITATTTQCERGDHTQINTGPNVFVNTGPFTETPWTPVPPVSGVGGWAVPWWIGR